MSTQRRPSRYEFSAVRVRFESDGTTCVGRLYRPDAPREPPVVVMAPGLAGERTFGLPAFAERLAERGYAVFAFDYRGFGESDGRPRQLVDPRGQVADYHAAVDRVTRFEDLDTGRLALWGTSLSGGHVLTLAGLDRRVSAVVAQVPVVDGRALVREWPRRTRLRAVAAGLRDRVGSLVGRGHGVRVVGDPGEFALVSEPGAKRAYLRLVPPDAAWENDVPARVLLALPRYRPGLFADRVSVPTLLVAGQRDGIVPVESVAAAADDLPDGTLVRLPVGHFDVYDGEAFEQAVGHQLTFLDSAL